MLCLGRCNAPKRDTGGHILTEWPFFQVKSPIKHNGHYAQWFDWQGEALFLLRIGEPLDLSQHP